MHDDVVTTIAAHEKPSIEETGSVESGPDTHTPILNTCTQNCLNHVVNTVSVTVNSITLNPCLKNACD